MATATLVAYTNYLLYVHKADIDFDTVTFKALLVNSSYTPNRNTHDFLDDVRSFEVTGTNWAANGQTVTITPSLDSGSDQIRFAVSDISVGTVTLTDGKTVIIYNSTPGADSGRHLIAYGTFDTALAPTAGTLAIDFATSTWNIDCT